MIYLCLKAIYKRKEEPERAAFYEGLAQAVKQISKICKWCRPFLTSSLNKSTLEVEKQRERIE